MAPHSVSRLQTLALGAKTRDEFHSLSKFGIMPSEPREAEHSTVGLYEPGFIHLQINTAEELNDFNKLAASAETAKWVSTFLHEYIHFLQDISTTHGLLNFIMAVDHLKNANKQVRDSSRAEFKIPLKISNTFEFSTNEALMRLYYGDGSAEAKDITYQGYFEEAEDVTPNQGNAIRVPKYKIRYHDNGAQTNMVCRFGSVHLKEYMAHAIQNQYAPGTTHFAIPYVLAELIVKKEYPPLAKDSSLIIALCDAALMHLHPAHLFFHALRRMQQTQWAPGDADSVYTFAFDGLELSWRNQTETFESLYKKQVELAIRQFSDALKADIFANNVIWFKAIVQEAMNLRTESRAFLTNLVASPRTFSRLFFEVFNRLGTPFMTNAEFKGYFHPPEKLKALAIYPYYPKVFQAVRSTYRGRRDCRLFPFCDSRPDKKVTNDTCLTSPWERVNLRDLCPYAQMWRTWGLEGKTPVT